jgi:hypothetical protein
MRTSSPRSVLARDDERPSKMAGMPHRSIGALLQARETGSGQSAARADAEVLRWTMGRWMSSRGLSSGYCELSGAKSTIALAFSADGTRFASTHGDHTVKVFDSSSWRVR